MIKAVIFDMDGLLINSEPFWKSVEQEVFKTVGIDLTIEMCLETVGLRIDEVVTYWHEKMPWTTPSKIEIETAIIERMAVRIKAEGEALPGVFEVLDFFETRQIPMAIASSSYFSLIHAVVEKLGIATRLSVLHSAEFEPYGKPNPSIFLTTAQKLGVAPTQCLVFEDSLNGVIAGKAARMKTVAVPEFDNPKFIIADAILNSLEEWNENIFQELCDL